MDYMGGLYWVEGQERQEGGAGGGGGKGCSRLDMTGAVDVRLMKD